MIDEKKLVPAELGFVVNDLLAEHFPNVFDIGFTSQLEDELDEIASGERAWIPTLREFYAPFAETMKLAETSDRARETQGRTGRSGLRKVRSTDGHQDGQIRQVHGLQRIPGMPKRATDQIQHWSAMSEVSAGRGG